MVQFGLFFWGAEQGRDAHAAMRDVVRELPLSMNAIQLAASPRPRRRSCRRSSRA